MFNLHWNGDAFNQKFVISQRTPVLHACLSPKRQNLTTLASEKMVFIPYLLTGLPVWWYAELTKRLNYISQFWISMIAPKCQPYFNWHPPSKPPKLILRNHPRKISSRFLSTTRCFACRYKQSWSIRATKLWPMQIIFCMLVHDKNMDMFTGLTLFSWFYICSI